MNIEAIKNRLRVLTDGRYRDFYRQRMIVDVEKREQHARRIAAHLPRLVASENANSELSDVTSAGARLQSDGYAMLEPLLAADQLASMRAFFCGEPCSDPYRRLPAFVGASNAPAGTHVAFFDNEVVSRAPFAFEIANNPVVLNAVSSFLGAKPTISYMTAWWSLPAGDGTAQHAERYHRDVDDIKFVKLFVYLTDVDGTAGPHRYIRGSHAINKLTDIRRYDDSEVHSAFGRENEIEFTGPAGTCFLENTYGFHRGFPPISTPRMIFQVLYTLRPSIYGPKRPVKSMAAAGVPAGLDPYVNRVYLSA